MPFLIKADSVSQEIFSRIAKRMNDHWAADALGRNPTLATVLVGEDAASQVYVNRKGEACARLGFGHRDFKLPKNTSQQELLSLIDKLNKTKDIDGILVQRPLPKGLVEADIFDRIDSAKDVDCFSPTNVGLLHQGRGTLLPCTPAGILELLRFYKIELAGKNALVVGRSEIVGKPMAALLIQANATVTVAHSKTKDLSECVACADLVVAAIGRPTFLGGSLPWKKTATVIDVGINRGTDGKLVGDVDFAAVAPKVAAISPVPGGVGPMTIAMLMWNTLLAAENRRAWKESN